MSQTPLQSAKDHWSAGRNAAALAEAWRAFDANPDGFEERKLVAHILRDVGEPGDSGHGEALRALAMDRDIDPSHVSAAGWRHLSSEIALVTDDAAALAPKLEDSALALTLLNEDIVAEHHAEQALTRVRRWLLTERHWTDFPRLAAALIAQAAMNGGAWPFDEAERALLGASGDFARAYLPERDTLGGAGYEDPVTRAVADQYEGWPYPQWRRITRPKPGSLAAEVRRLDPEGPETIPANGAQILIAGCGTGRQVVLSVGRYPGDRITAIDISQASLRYAERRGAEAGVTGVDYQVLDLHDAAKLGRSFDAVFCTGVLHHLPDPEAGWAALAGVLRPGGVMHVMVYSKISRMRVKALRQSLRDLEGQSMSDDLLREARRRIALRTAGRPERSTDFYSLAGTHDLLMHRHEDPFDVPRVRAALDRLGLRLIHFEIPRNALKAAYHEEHPDDPLQRDFDAWAKLERGNPGLYSKMYDLWCRKP